MGWKDQAGALTDVKILFVINSKSTYRSTLSFQCNRIQNHTITNQVSRVFMKNSRRNLMQYYFLAFNIQGMACIGSSLEPGNDIILRSEKIYNLSFSLITPLKA